MSQFLHTAIEQALAAQPPAAPAPSAPGPGIRARILYPALGCPAVVGPRANPAAGAPSGAQHRITVLLVSDRERLTPADAAAHLRLVPWAQRARRHAPATFAAANLRVRSNVPPGPQRDERGEGVVFGAERPEGAIAASLSSYVRRFYAGLGLRHLHEITVSETVCARLAEDLFQLFWDVPDVPEDGSSAEMDLLIERFAKPRRRDGGGATAEWQRFHREHLDFLLDEYRLDFNATHLPYLREDSARRRTEVLHPVFVRRQAQTLRLAHLTDTHVDTRHNIYEHNLRVARQMSWDGNRLKYDNKELRFNNANRSFEELYAQAKRLPAAADAILITGDLIEYGRGHIGQSVIDRVVNLHRLDDLDAYHQDRNWFLFYYLLASGDRYSKPVFTSLGNHDWRLNPFPPFTFGATDPREMIHNYGRFTEEQRREIVRIAHGPGHEGYLYPAQRAGWDLFRRGLSFRTSPLETDIASVAWYLLLINPFLDYAVPMPGGQRLLMLDWGEAEDVDQHTPWAGDFGTPSEKNVLSPLQRWHVERFTQLPGAAKVVGKHAPVLGPRPSWTEEDLVRGDTTYTREQSRQLFGDMRVPVTHHTLCAIPPRGEPRLVAAVYGSMRRDRDWLIERLAAPSSGVRLVLTGHIHRHNLLVAYPASDGNGWLMKPVREDEAPGYSRRRSPLYVNGPSCGPRPGRYTEARAEHVAPGFNVVALGADGAIGPVRHQRLGEPNHLPAPTATARPQILEHV